MIDKLRKETVFLPKLRHIEPTGINRDDCGEQELTGMTGGTSQRLYIFTFLNKMAINLKHKFGLLSSQERYFDQWPKYLSQQQNNFLEMNHIMTWEDLTNSYV